MIIYVKNKRFDLNAMTSALKFAINCESFGLKGSFQGTCFGHALSKHVNMALQKKKSTKKIFFYQVYPSIFAKMHHLA
jgi:hypothetical protein